MRKKRAVARSKLELSVGNIRRIVKEIRMNMDRLRVQLGKENEKTINFLIDRLDMWAEGVVEPTTLEIDSKKKNNKLGLSSAKLTSSLVSHARCVNC